MECDMEMDMANMVTSPNDKGDETSKNVSPQQQHENDHKENSSVCIMESLSTNLPSEEKVTPSKSDPAAQVQNLFSNPLYGELCEIGKKMLKNEDKSKDSVHLQEKHLSDKEYIESLPTHLISTKIPTDEEIKQMKPSKLAKLLSIARACDWKQTFQQCMDEVSEEKCNEILAIQMYYAMAKYPTLEDLKQLMLSRIKKYFLHFAAAPEFVKIPAKHLIQLLRSDETHVNSEMEVIMIVFSWLDYNVKERRTLLLDILPFVRLNLIPFPFMDLAFQNRKVGDIKNFLSAAQAYARNHENVAALKILKQHGYTPRCCRPFIRIRTCPYHNPNERRIVNAFWVFHRFKNFMRRLGIPFDVNSRYPFALQI